MTGSEWQRFIFWRFDMSNQPVLAFAWYQSDEWYHLKEVVDDPSTLDDTYEEWRNNAESSVAGYRANGYCVDKISIKISELLIWCENKGVKPEGEARAEYTVYLARKRDK